MKLPRTAIVTLLAGAVCISFAPVFARLAFELEAEACTAGCGKPLGLVAVAFWRCALGAPLLWAIHWLRPQPDLEGSGEAKRGWPWFLAIPGLFFAGDMATWHKAFEYTSVANSTLLTNLASVIVAVISWIWLGERMGWKFLVGGTTALVGAGILLGVDFSKGSDPVRGDIYGLVTACFYAGYILTAKRYRARHSAAHILAWGTTVAAVILFVVAYLAGEGLTPTTPMAWVHLVLLAVVSHVGGQGMIVHSLARLPASFATLSLLTQPVGTGILGWFILGQTMTPLQMFGGFVVLAGIYLAGQARRKS